MCSINKRVLIASQPFIKKQMLEKSLDATIKLSMFYGTRYAKNMNKSMVQYLLMEYQHHISYLKHT